MPLFCEAPGKTYEANRETFEINCCLGRDCMQDGVLLRRCSVAVLVAVLQESVR